MRTIVGALIVAVGLAATTVIAQQPERREMAQKTGWWVRVDTQDTQASSVTLEIGTNAKNRHAWRSWSAGQDSEFDVPGNYQSAKQLYLQASANPDGQNMRFCVFYKEAATKRFNFSGNQESEIKQSDRDDSCK